MEKHAKNASERLKRIEISCAKIFKGRNFLIDVTHEKDLWCASCQFPCDGEMISLVESAPKKVKALDELFRTLTGSKGLGNHTRKTKFTSDRSDEEKRRDGVVFKKAKQGLKKVQEHKLKKAQERKLKKTRDQKLKAQKDAKREAEREAWKEVCRQNREVRRQEAEWERLREYRKRQQEQAIQKAIQLRTNRIKSLRRDTDAFERLLSLSGQITGMEALARSTGHKRSLFQISFESDMLELQGSRKVPRLLIADGDEGRLDDISAYTGFIPDDLIDLVMSFLVVCKMAHCQKLHIACVTEGCKSSNGAICNPINTCVCGGKTCNNCFLAAKPCCIFPSCEGCRKKCKRCGAGWCLSCDFGLKRKFLESTAGREKCCEFAPGKCSCIKPIECEGCGMILCDEHAEECPAGCGVRACGPCAARELGEHCFRCGGMGEAFERVAMDYFEDDGIVYGDYYDDDCHCCGNSGHSARNCYYV